MKLPDIQGIMSHRDDMGSDDVIMAANDIENSEDISIQEPTVVKFIEALAATYNSKQVSARFPGNFIS